jgi:hypothetical protein
MSQSYPEFLALMITYLDKIKNKDGDIALTSISESQFTTPSGSTPSGSTPSSSTPSGSPPSSSTPSGSTPSGSTPSSSTPSGSTPSGSTPSGSSPKKEVDGDFNDINLFTIEPTIYKSIQEAESEIQKKNSNKSGGSINVSQKENLILLNTDNFILYVLNFIGGNLSDEIDKYIPVKPDSTKTQKFGIVLNNGDKNGFQIIKYNNKILFDDTMQNVRKFIGFIDKNKESLDKIINRNTYDTIHPSIVIPLRDSGPRTILLDESSGDFELGGGGQNYKYKYEKYKAKYMAELKKQNKF